MAADASCASRRAPIASLIDKAVHDYHMIEAGDRILAGASGGKDSTALIEYLARRAQTRGVDFSLCAVNVQSDFAPPFPVQIAALFDKWGVPFKSIKLDILKQVKAGHKMNCWWCSTRRRSVLLDEAMRSGCNKIALGHHMDDILETLLMNALDRGELSTMPPSLQYNKYPVCIIRPLCYVCNAELASYAVQNGWGQYTCTCDYQSNSHRMDARAALDALTGGDVRLKEHLFAALCNIRNEYLP